MNNRFRRFSFPAITFGLAVLAWGIQAIVTQSLLLREALVLMFGSEFAWGVVLFAWLLGVAVGGALGGRISVRLRRPDVWLVAVLLLLSVAACVELWIFRGARAWLGVKPGELLPLPQSALAAVVFVSPASALVGLAFPLACRITERQNESDSAGPCAGGPTHASPGEPAGVGPLGIVYALESAGSLVGGAAFSFWAVERLAPIETALVCGVITAAACAGLLAATSRRPYGAVYPASLAAVGVVLLATVGDTLHDRLVHRRWRDVAPNYALCAQADSKYQNLAVLRLAEQFTLYCDGQQTSDFPDPYTFVPLAHFWMCQHPSPKRVLVIGGGAEGLLAEILRHSVEHVDYVEPDPRQIDIIRSYLAGADRRALRDERVTVHYVDARYFIKTQRNRFDLVIARVPEPMSALRARFYTTEFYRELRRAMTPDAVLCMTVAAAPGELSPASGAYLASVRATLRRHFPLVAIGWGDPAHVLAATKSGLVATDVEALARRYSARPAGSNLFHPLLFAEQLDPDKVRRRAEELDAVEDVEISTDLRPVVYVQRLALWDRMTGGPSGHMIERLRTIGWIELVAALAAVASGTVIVCYLRGRSRAGRKSQYRNPWVSTSAIILSVGTTGFATMALSIVWLYAFQNLYGYVYQRIGWIIAVFMGGLVLGCWLAGRRVKGQLAGSGTVWRRLIAVDVLLAILSAAVPVVLPALGAVQDTRAAFVLVEWAVSIMVALTGLLGGAAFALAGGLQLAATRRAGTAAGQIVGADHAGACAGALITGILLVPVFGTAAAAFLLAGMKLVSAALLVVGRWSWRAV